MTIEELDLTMFTKLEYFSGFLLTWYTFFIPSITLLVWFALKSIEKTYDPTAEMKKHFRVVNTILTLFTFTTLFVLFYSIIYSINTKHFWELENLNPYIDSLEEQRIANEEITQVDLTTNALNKGTVYWKDEGTINKVPVEIVISKETEEPYLTYKVIEGDISYIKGKKPIYFKGDKVGYKLYVPEDYDFEKVYFSK